MRHLHHLSLVTAAVLAVFVVRPAAAEAPAGPDSAQSKVARGRITEVRPAGNQFTLHTRKDGDLNLTVDPRSRLQIHEQSVKLGDLKPGMRVRVTYETKRGTNRVVSVTDPLITLGHVQKAANNAFDVARSYAFQQKASYQRKLQGLMQHIDEQIEDLQDQAAEAGAAAKEKYAREIQELRQKRTVLQEKLARVESATAQSWEDIRAGVNAAVNDVQQALERARTHIAEQNPPERR